MAGILRKKWLNHTLLIYWMIAVAAFITISNINTFRFIDFIDHTSDRLDSGGFFSSITYNADCLAEDTTVKRAQGNSSSALRSGLLRVFMFMGIPMAASYFTIYYSNVIKNEKKLTPKNLIILKLRI